MAITPQSLYQTSPIIKNTFILDHKTICILTVIDIDAIMVWQRENWIYDNLVQKMHVFKQTRHFCIKGHRNPVQYRTQRGFQWSNKIIWRVQKGPNHGKRDTTLPKSVKNCGWRYHQSISTIEWETFKDTTKINKRIDNWKDHQEDFILAQAKNHNDSWGRVFDCVRYK